MNRSIEPRRAAILLVPFAFALLLSLPAQAQEAGVAPAVAPQVQGEAVRVFLDCMRCDGEFLRTEINFIDYVRDRRDADVHLLVTTQNTGAGGTEFTMQFIGLGRFAGVTDDLRYASSPTDSQDQTRRGMAQVMKGGLIRYVMRTPLAQRMQLTFADGTPRRAGANAAGDATQVRDPWNAWVFRMSLGGSWGLEASRKNYNVNASASANRTTLDWKTQLSFNTRISESNTRVNDRWVDNEQKDLSLSSLTVRSMSDHWSAGARTDANHSTFQNRDLALRFAPAVEFNFYPYSESTRRQLTLQYSVGANQVEYIQETIFDRTEQALLDQALELSFNTRQTWGNARVSLQGSHYLHDFEKYRLEANGGMDVRLFRGLSVNVNGSAERIHDQLHLVKGNLTEEQILLRQREIASSYRYNVSFGLAYSFGSIFSPVVNPRMGGGGPGGGGPGGGGPGGGGFGGGGGGGGRN